MSPSRGLLFVSVAALAGNMAMATEHEVNAFGPVLDACYATASDTDGRAACLGQMSSVCMDSQDGGHSTLGMSSCLYAESQVWDGYLNIEYQATMAWAKAMDADEAVHFPEFARRAETLRDAQRAWITFRDAECGLDYAIWGAGSMRHIAGTQCIMQTTAERTIRLRAIRETMQ